MQIIRGISYRHIAGYLRVVGSTRQSAKQNTQKIEKKLKSQLPEGTTVKPGRYRGRKGLWHMFEVPVILNRPGVRKILATFALSGGAP